MPEILYEDNHIIAVYKKSSDLVQGDKSGDDSLDNQVKRYIEKKYKKPGDAFLGKENLLGNCEREASRG